MQMQVMVELGPVWSVWWGIRSGRELVDGGGKIPVRGLLDLLKVGYVFVKVDEGRSIFWI